MKSTKRSKNVPAYMPLRVHGLRYQHGAGGRLPSISAVIIAMLIMGTVGVCPSPAAAQSVASERDSTRSAAEVEALQQEPRPTQFVLPEVNEQTPGPPSPPTSDDASASGEVGRDGLNATEAVPSWASHRLIHFYPPRAKEATATATKVSPSSKEVAPLVAGAKGDKLTYWGGPVQHEPQLYLLFWGERFWSKGMSPVGLGAELEFFYRGLEKESLVNPAWQGILSQYWSDSFEANRHAKVVGESHLNAVESPQNVTDAEVRQEIDYWIEDGAKVGPNTQFVVMLAPGSTFSALTGCAYHSVGEYSGQQYVYSVIPYSGDANKYYKYSACNRLEWKTSVGEVQQLMWSTTGAASHEFAESVTDPLLSLSAPYTSVWAWDENLTGETEIADLCIDEEEAGHEHAIEELPEKNGRVGWTYVNKLWDDEGGNKCKLEDPPYAESAVSPKSSTWALENFESNNINAFYKNTSDQLANEYALNGTWTNQTLTSGISGTPAVIENMAGNNMNVFYENESGQLTDEYWFASTGWTNWVMADGISGIPAATVNLAENNTNVFYKNTSGQLVNEYWTSSSGWTSQVLAGGISGTPTAIENDASNNMNVFYKNTSGQLVNEYWTPSSGWSSQVLAGGISGTPVAVENTSSTNMNVFYENESGQLVDEYWVNGNPNNGWSSQELDGGIAGTPVAVENGAGNNMNVFYKNTSGQLADEYWVNGNPNNGWANMVLESGISGTPAATVNATDNNMNVFYRNTSGQLTDEYWINGSAGNGWSNTVLASGIIAP